jgi:hypothetical protein
VPEQHKWLCSVLRGHFGYYAVPTNFPALQQVRWHISGFWLRSLQRRSQRGHWTKEKRRVFRERFPLPSPQILHPWPSERFASR